MGSVPDLYTTGDNDPEIEPVRYYRHYLYCDACGSFELDTWMAPDHHEALERARQRLGTAALYISPLVLVAGWEALALVFSLSFLAALPAGIALALVGWGFIGGARWGEEPLATRWRVFKGAFLWLLIVLVGEWLVDVFTLSLSPWTLFVAGVVVAAGLLVAREVLGSKIEVVGMRCKPCGATYAHGTPFFTDLDANPRNLTVADVPRPLGLSLFEVGKSVAYEPPDPPSRLPA